MLTRDGKKYKTLFEPNPLLADQSSISQKDLVFHNFNWVAETQKKIKINPLPPTIEPVPKEQPQIVEPEKIPQSVPQESQELTEEEFFTASETVLESQEIIAENLIDNTVILHCLPAFVKDRNGNISKLTIYGDKFLFDGEIIDYSNLGIQIWTTDNRITKNSIVTPKSWKHPREESLEIFLTCRITRIDLKPDGRILYGIISDIQPDFS